MQKRSADQFNDRTTAGAGGRRSGRARRSADGLQRIPVLPIKQGPVPRRHGNFDSDSDSDAQNLRIQQRTNKEVGFAPSHENEVKKEERKINESSLGLGGRHVIGDPGRRVTCPGEFGNGFIYWSW